MYIVRLYYADCNVQRADAIIVHGSYYYMLLLIILCVSRIIYYYKVQAADKYI